METINSRTVREFSHIAMGGIFLKPRPGRYGYYDPWLRVDTRRLRNGAAINSVNLANGGLANMTRFSNVLQVDGFEYLTVNAVEVGIFKGVSEGSVFLAREDRYARCALFRISETRMQDSSIMNAVVIGQLRNQSHWVFLKFTDEVMLDPTPKELRDYAALFV